MADLMDVGTSLLDRAVDGEDLEVYAVHTVAATVQGGAGGVVRRVDRAETMGIGVRVFRDGRVGYASTADLSGPALETSVARARANALASDPDPPNLPPEPQPATPAAARDSRRLAATTLDDKIRLVVDLIGAVESLDPRVRAVDMAEYHDERREVTVVSTRGVRSQYTRGRCELWVDALGDDPAGPAVDTGYWSGSAPGDVDTEAVAREAVRRTTRLLGRPVPRPAGLDVLLDYVVLGELLAAVGRGCTGGALGTGRSPFAGLLGEPVGSAAVTLVDDGTWLGAYDDEGLPRRRTGLIDRGVLTGGLHSTATAHAIGGGATSTGNARRLTHRSAPRAAPAALRLDATTGGGAMLTDVDEAVYVQQLTGAGSGINAVTGRVDVGAVGWLLRGGEPAGPVATVPLSTDLVSFLHTVTDVADDARQVLDRPVTAATVACAPGLLRE